jgi:tellurite resistance protein TerC
METMTILWTVFIVTVIAALTVDFAAARGKTSQSLSSSLKWTGFWIALSLAFGGLVFAMTGRDSGVQYLSGYLLEYSLSVDNLFVFLLLMTSLKTPKEHQYKVLFWGIVIAIVSRIIFIVAGVALVSKFSFVLWIFGLFLLYTGIKIGFGGSEKAPDPEKNLAYRAVRAFVPISSDCDGGRLFTRKGGVLHATPIFTVILMIGTVDIVFAVDSIPAVLAVTQDTFIVIASNIFAVMGLRSLFFALSGIVKMFRFLHYGLAVILSFLGVKMMLPALFHIPGAERFLDAPPHIATPVSLAVVGGVIALSVIASVMFPSKEEKESG